MCGTAMFRIFNKILDFLFLLVHLILNRNLRFIILVSSFIEEQSSSWPTTLIKQHPFLNQISRNTKTNLVKK